MISLHELYARHFLSLGEVRIPLANQGLVLVLGLNKDVRDPAGRYGTNAAGKSSIFDAIEWALCEEARGAAKDDVVNRIYAKDGMLLELPFDISGHPYSTRVARRHPQYGSCFQVLDQAVSPARDIIQKEVMVAGQPKKMDPAKQLARLLGIDNEMFHGAVYLGQDQVHEFVYGTNEVRQRFFAQLFGFNIWKTAQDLAKREADALDAETKEIEVRVESLRTQSVGDILSDDREDLLAALAGLQERRGTAEADVADLENQARSYSSRLALRQADIQRYQEQERQAIRARQLAVELETVRADLQAKLVELPDWVQQDRNLFNTRYQKIHNDSAVVDARIADLIGVLQTLESSHLAACPTCKRPVTADELTVMRADLERLQQDKTVIDNRRQGAQQIADRLYLCDQLQTRIAAFHIPASMETDQQGLAQAQAESDELLRLRDEAQGRYAATRQEYVTLSTECARLEERTRAVEAAAVREGDRTARLDALERRRREVELRLGVLRVLQKDVFPALRIQKIRSLLSVLNREVQGYVDVLSAAKIRAGFEFRVKGSKEELELWVEDDRKGRLPIKNYSGGERKRVVIAVVFGLWRLATSVGRTFNLVIFDEILRDVDELGHGQVLELLCSMRDAGRTVLVSTNANPASLNLGAFDSIWVAVKEQDVTSLVTIRTLDELETLRAA